ncbi:hypothetical protein PCK2_000827 [Pneumocystis canis]|nr:hypothetical protein PCK2_000827 [Pneumocystis canis]
MNMFNTYDLEYIDLKRLESRTPLEEIFERYGKDMTEESDEVDLRTGEVIVNRGHLNRLRVSWFVGKETLNFNNDHLENDFFENILSLISINHKNTLIDHKLRKRTFPRKFPSKEQIFQQFGSLGPSIIKLIETQKRKRKHYFKKKRMPLKYSKGSKGRLYNSKIEEMNKLTTCIDSQMTSFKFQNIPIHVPENMQQDMTRNFNNHSITETSTEQSTNSDTEDSHQQKPHCNKIDFIIHISSFYIEMDTHSTL